jgi:hypothetical protein
MIKLYQSALNIRHIHVHYHPAQTHKQVVELESLIRQLQDSRAS